jgi:acetylornithine deacetylase/succinyl-diaminopimelate desuccinylase-like protein
VLEGGQGFTPSHRMKDIQSRMTEAAVDAVKKYCKLRGRKFDASMIEMTFDRLHNDAYADSPEIAPMQALRAACQACGIELPPPVAWNTSCDARLYHRHGHPVAIFGAGKLEAAHSDTEYVDLDDVQKALAVSTIATLMLCA